jgi:hypothetical protein
MLLEVRGTTQTRPDRSLLITRVREQQRKERQQTRRELHTGPQLMHGVRNSNFVCELVCISIRGAFVIERPPRILALTVDEAHEMPRHYHLCRGGDATVLAPRLEGEGRGGTSITAVFLISRKTSAPWPILLKGPTSSATRSEATMSNWSSTCLPPRAPLTE